MSSVSQRVGVVLGLAVVGVGGVLASSMPPPVPARKPAVSLPETGTLVFEKTEIDFGEISDEKAIEMEIPFTNTGDQPVTIRRMHAHCGCTTPELEKKTYQPGESGAIKVIFDPHRRYGAQAKKVTVYTDDPVLPIKNLMVRGYVRAIAYVEPFLTNFGEVGKGETSRKITYVIGEREDFEITEIVSSNPEILSAKVIGSEPINKDGVRMIKHTIQIDLLGAKKAGRYAEHLTLKTNDPRRPEVDANVLVRVPSELKLAWAMVRVGKLAVGDSFEQEMVIGHVNKKPFKIVSVEPEGDMLEAEFTWTEADEAAIAHTIVVKGRAVKGGGVISDRIIVTTDLEDEPPMTINYKGRVIDPTKDERASGSPAAGGSKDVDRVDD